MENSDDGKIVTLVQPKADERSLLNIVAVNPKTYSQKSCKHALEIDEQDRTIQCSRCKVFVEPFEYILKCATDAEHVVRELEELHRRRKELRESVANLEREEKNAKARLRAARTAILYAENDCKNVEQGVTR